MDRAFVAAGVIDVRRIDPYDRGTLIREELSRTFSRRKATSAPGRWHAHHAHRGRP